jgi:sodium transport system permease protein
MGPAIVLLALLARGGGTAPGGGQPWAAMAAVFAVMAAFTSAAGVATDLVAGERERRSLVPLLGGASRREHVILGKWLAASVFAAAGLFLNVLAFFAVLMPVDLAGRAIVAVTAMAPALLQLGLLAAALGILVSTLSRNAKESQTWLSVLIFAAMAGSMWLAFRPPDAAGWSSMVPLAGHQRLLEWGFAVAAAPDVDAPVVALRSAALGSSTAALTAIVLAITCLVFRRDECVCGG